MNFIYRVVFAVLFLGLPSVFSQVAPDCGNAIPICTNAPINGGTNGFGQDDFASANSSGCLEPTGSGVIESNSAWYRFRTAASGQLGFNIGFDASEDWDFALYKTDDCGSLGEPIRCNFFDNQDQNSYMGVGEDPMGNNSTVLYEDWLTVMSGEDYYLLINNFSNSNAGVSIQFSGNIFIENPTGALDCTIISNLLGAPISACENDLVSLDATTIDAVSYNWYRGDSSGFQAISGANNATYQVSASALYRVEVITAMGDNIISDVQVVFAMAPQSFLVADEEVCSALLVFDLSEKDTEVVGSGEIDKFIVSYHDSQADAINGVNSLLKSYTLNIGSKTIYSRLTSIDNPTCFDASKYFQLTIHESPILDFTTEIFICEDGGATIGEPVPNPMYSYVWDSGELTATKVVTQPGVYALTVLNAQGINNCLTTRSVTVVVSKPPNIADVVIEDLQSNNTVTILPEYEGDWGYQIDSEGFQSSNVFTRVSPGRHTVAINDPSGCGVVVEDIVVVGFSKFFTPNGDGINDEWQITGISKLKNPSVFIYDRYGILLKQLDAKNNSWNGTWNGKDMPASDYWFKLSYESDDGQRNVAKYINNHFTLKR